MSAWTLFGEGLKRFNLFMSYVSALLIVVCAGVFVYEVMTRYLIQISNDWVIELSVFMLIAATFLAAAYTQMERAHVGIEVLDEILSPRANRWRYLVADALSMLVCAYIALKAWEYCSQAWSEGWRTGSTWAPPLWIPYSFMGFGMSALVLQQLVQIVDDLLRPEIKPEHHYLGE